MERPASETAGLFDDIQPQKAHISCWKALLAGGSQKKIIKKRYNFSGGFFIRQGFSTGSRHHLVERSCVWRLDVGGLFWHLFASKMLPSPDKSSTRNSFCFYHDPRSRVNSQSNAYFLQRTGAGIFSKNGNSSAGGYFSGLLFCWKE
jgi:hypothetical protein